MQRIRINVFGRAMRLCAGGLPESERVKLAAACKKYDLKQEIALFTPDLINELNLLSANGNPVKSWKDISEEFKCYGYLPEYRSTIEIKVDGKRLSRFSAHSVLGEGLLFPIFETTAEKVTLHAEFVMRETLTGLTGVYRFTHTDFDAGLLSFTISQITFRDKNIVLITGIAYKGELLSRDDDDAVVTSWEL